MRPTLRGVLVLGLCLPAALVPALVWTRLWTVWAATLGLGLLLLGLDAALRLRRRSISVAAEVPPALYIGDDSDRLTLELGVPGRAALEVLPELDDDLVAQPAQRAWVDGRARLAFALSPRRRAALLSLVGRAGRAQGRALPRRRIGVRVAA